MISSSSKQSLSLKVSNSTINMLFRLTLLIEKPLIFLQVIIDSTLCSQGCGSQNRSQTRCNDGDVMKWETGLRQIIAVSCKHRITGSSNYWNNYSYKKYYVLSRNPYLEQRILKEQMQNPLRAKQLLKIFFLIWTCSILRINFLL